MCEVTESFVFNISKCILCVLSLLTNLREELSKRPIVINEFLAHDFERTLFDRLISQILDLTLREYRFSSRFNFCCFPYSKVESIERNW